MRYDLIVLGNTPAAQATALAAGRLRQNVAWVVPETPLSNCWQHSAVTVSRRLRQAADLFLPRCSPRPSVNRPLDCSFAQLVAAARAMEADERAALARRIERLQIDQFSGAPRLVDSQTVVVEGSAQPQVLETEFIVVATGTIVNQSPTVPFDGERILCADDVPSLTRVPRSLLVVGASQTGIELSLLFALLGTRVTLIERQPRIQTSGAASEWAVLLRQAQGLGVRLLTDSDVVALNTESRRSVRAELLSGESLAAECVLWTTERIGNTQSLGLSTVGIRPDEHGRLWCDESLQTWQPNILGIGDVVGHPHSLAVMPDAPRQLVWNALRGDSAPLINSTRPALEAALSPVT